MGEASHNIHLQRPKHLVRPCRSKKITEAGITDCCMTNDSRSGPACDLHAACAWLHTQHTFAKATAPGDTLCRQKSQRLQMGASLTAAWQMIHCPPILRDCRTAHKRQDPAYNPFAAATSSVRLHHLDQLTQQRSMLSDHKILRNIYICCTWVFLVNNHQTLPSP